jgi:hypothetical protein
VLACLTLAASALTQLVSARSRFVVPGGLAVLGVSVLLLGGAGAWNNAVLLVAASLAAGVGQGLAFRTVFNDVAGRVEPARQAQTVSSLYVITYLGSAVPVLGLGWASGVFGLEPSVAVFVVLCGSAALILAAITLRQAVLDRP